jgi:hypothetical protein
MGAVNRGFKVHATGGSQQGLQSPEDQGAVRWPLGPGDRLTSRGRLNVISDEHQFSFEVVAQTA